MFWQKAASERYKRGSFTFEYTSPSSFGVMPDATQAPDGSIIIISHMFCGRNSDPGTPPLQTGYNNISTVSEPAYSWDGRTWYTRNRLQWAVASSATRAVSPTIYSAGYPFKAYMTFVVRSNGGEALTMNTAAVGSLDLSDTKAPSTVFALDMLVNKEYASPSSPVNQAEYTFDDEPFRYVQQGFLLNPGTVSNYLFTALTQASVFGSETGGVLKEDVGDYFATGSNTLSRSAGDMEYNHAFIIEAS